MTPTYAIAIPGQQGRYPGFSDRTAAAGRALALVLEGALSVTILQVNGPDDDVSFTPIATIKAMTA